MSEDPTAKSPVGRWKTIDDLTGKAKSVVLIWEEGGKLFGRVQKLVDPDPKDPNPTCDGCAGAQKGKPVLGMRIFWDLRRKTATDGPEVQSRTSNREERPVPALR